MQKAKGEYVFFDKKGVVKSPNTEAAAGLAERLTALLDGQKRSQRQLAASTPGLNHAIISAIKTQGRDPQLSSLALVADALGVRLEELVCGVTTTVIGDTSAERRVIRMLDVFAADDYSRKGATPVGWTVVPASEYPADVFAVQQVDDSMAGAFEKGDIVFLTPADAANPGSTVLARAGERVVLRGYMPRYSNSGQLVSFELEPINNRWPRIVCDKSFKGEVLGVVAGKMARV